MINLDNQIKSASERQITPKARQADGRHSLEPADGIKSVTSDVEQKDSQGKKRRSPQDNPALTESKATRQTDESSPEVGEQSASLEESPTATYDETGKTQPAHQIDVRV